jgi:hypothetical protein
MMRSIDGMVFAMRATEIMTHRTEDYDTIRRANDGASNRRALRIAEHDLKQKRLRVREQKERKRNRDTGLGTSGRSW